MILNFIFLFFQLFFVEKRKRVAGFQHREIKFSLEMISVIKTINFYIKWFHIIRKIKIKCFLFTLKAPEKTYLSLRRFFILDCLRILRLFFVFLKVLIGLTRFQRCFLNVLGQKNEFKMDFGVAKTKTLFLQPS